MSFGRWLKSLRLGSGGQGAVAGAVDAAPKTLDVAVWAHDRLAPSKGSSTEAGRLHADYCALAAKQGAAALPRAEFEVALAILCKHAGLGMHTHDFKVYVQDVKIAA